MKCFIWFAADEEDRRTMKVTAVAADEGQARRLLLDERMHLPLEARKYIMATPPSMVIGTPFGLYEASANGKAASWIWGGEGFGG